MKIILQSRGQAELALWENRTTLRVEGEFALTTIDHDLLSTALAFVELTTNSTGAGMFSRQLLHWTTTPSELSGPGNIEISIGEQKEKVIHKGYCLFGTTLSPDDPEAGARGRWADRMMALRLPEVAPNWPMSSASSDAEAWESRLSQGVQLEVDDRHAR